MLDIFKSGLIKRTVHNGAICLYSHGGLGVNSSADHLQHVVFFSWQTSPRLGEFNQVEHLDKMLALLWSSKRSLSSSDSLVALSLLRNTGANLCLIAGDFVWCWWIHTFSAAVNFAYSLVE
jgi:hypothetical protein